MTDKIICLIRKKEVSSTKEEKVRQSYLGNLLYSLGYPIETISVEVPIYHGRDEVLDIETKKKKRADIVIYDDESRNDIKTIIEVKKEKEKTGEEQVKSYGNVSNARYLVWYNGYNPIKVWKRILNKNSWVWKQIPSLPPYGFEEGDVLPTKENLKEIINVKGLFKSINDFIWVNGNIKNKKEIFLQFLYVLFIKLFDEYINENPNFYITESEYQQIVDSNKCPKFEERFRKLFLELKESSDFKKIFDETDKISLEPRLLAEIVYRLQFLKVRGSDHTGEAFQLFISPYYRGDNDQYLTPEPVIEMVMNMIKPKIKDNILDPSCGTGRFLTHTITYLSDTLKKQNVDIKNWASSHVFGIDIDKTLVKISKLYMVLIGDGHTNIFRDNSLDKPAEEYAVFNNDISMIITNPPFGSKEKVVDREVLINYDLGHVWNEELNKTDELMKKGQTQGVLMLERDCQFLKTSGIIAIVLPDGILSNLEDKYIRKWITDNFEILSIISLPEETFRVETIGVSVKTSVLIARKKEGVTKHQIFFASPKTIGYNLQGDIINSNEVLDVAKYYNDLLKKEVCGKYMWINLSNENLIDRMDADFHLYQVNTKNTFPLSDICDIFVGKTPGKSNYLDKGKIKILKVRCLTNKMVDWSSKKRDFVSQSWYDGRNKEKVDVKEGDIILAAAAHMKRYIGDEIDLIDEIPKRFSKVIASAKIIVLRVKNNKINPYVLLLYLRTEEAYRQIQSIIRGQTAEIYEQDLKIFRIPNTLLKISEDKGDEIEGRYKNTIRGLRENEANLEKIQRDYQLKQHDNILHFDSDEGSEKDG